jgi:transcriptional regulator NrdR family protein
MKYRCPRCTASNDIVLHVDQFCANGDDIFTLISCNKCGARLTAYMAFSRIEEEVSK